MDTVKLPLPYRLGLPKRFSSWRLNQPESVLRIVDAEVRFPVLNAPVGAGKSLTIAAALQLLGGKSVYLTSTNTLLKQLEEFYELGWVKVIGQGNYDCKLDPTVKVDLGVCHAGEPCDLKYNGCYYFDAVRLATSMTTSVTFTNYAWWLAHNRYGEGFPPIDNLILDEAHAAPDELADFLSCDVTKEQVNTLLGRYEPPNEMRYVIVWAHRHATELLGAIESIKLRARSSMDARRRLRAMKNLHSKLARLAEAKPEDWVMERGPRGWRFDPVWPGPYRELLFRETKKVIFVSATIRPKTLELLDIKKEEYEFHETPSTFPVSRRPVIHFTGDPRVALTHRADDALLRLWVTRIDNLIRRRLDRKGIIHCVSYARRDYLVEHSRFRQHFITHESGQQIAAVEAFKTAKAPAIFLSPSATTGLDFPYQECEFQIIAKVPFPDQRSKILIARTKRDPEYGMYLTCLDIVQATGRGMRAPDDQCETFIVDDQWQWVKGKYKKFLPRWFLEACKRTEFVPNPPPKLAKRKS